MPKQAYFGSMRGVPPLFVFDPLAGSERTMLDKISGSPLIAPLALLLNLLLDDFNELANCIRALFQSGLLCGHPA